MTNKYCNALKKCVVFYDRIYYCGKRKSWNITDDHFWIEEFEKGTSEKDSFLNPMTFAIDDTWSYTWWGDPKRPETLFEGGNETLVTGFGIKRYKLKSGLKHGAKELYQLPDGGCWDKKLVDLFADFIGNEDLRISRRDNVLIFRTKLGQAALAQIIRPDLSDYIFVGDGLKTGTKKSVTKTVFIIDGVDAVFTDRKVAEDYLVNTKQPELITKLKEVILY